MLLSLTILLITIVTLIFVYLTSSNFLKFDDNWISRNINLGLDLQGGSYLLLEIDTKPVITQKIQNTASSIRTLLKQKKINFTFFLSTEIDKIENSNKNSIYALSKFFLQDSLRFILIKNNISLIKIDNVYGPYDLNFNRLIPSLMLKLLFNNKGIKVKLAQQKKLIYVKDLLSVIFKTIKNKKSFNIIHIKGKNFNILKLWKSINKILHNKHKRITQNNDCYNFIETFEWYKDNLWMIKKKKYPIK